MPRVAGSDHRGWRNRCLPVILAAAAAATAAGCEADKPEPERQKPSDYTIQGTVLASTGRPNAPGMVALLYAGGGASQFRVVRQRMNEQNNIWPYEPFQQFMRGLENQEPVSGCLCSANGTFAFPKAVRRGTYLITVGIPTRVDFGVQLPKEWPAILASQRKFTFHSSQYELPARSAWFYEVKVDDSDRQVTLGGDDIVDWPVPTPDRTQLDALRRKLQDIDRLGKQHAGLQAQCDQAQQKARESGQPFHVKAFMELEAKANNSKSILDRAQSELDAGVRQALQLQ